jgi:hypothetical protein
MWKWLLDAHRLLGLTVEVLDDQFTVVTPSKDGRILRERYEAARSASLADILAASMTTDAPFVSIAGGVHLACVPIVGAGALAGAVLVATDDHVRFEDRDIARLGVLLAEAIADQLSRPAPEHRGQLHQISALYQLLQHAIASGSEREIVRTFAEALCIWEEIEVLAYRADLGGRYLLALALPGSDPEIVPRWLNYEPAFDAPRVRRLSPFERDNLGFGGIGETVLVRVVSDGGRWLIALNSPREAADRERSEMYVAALGHALNGCVAVETSRLTWEVMQQFVHADPPDEAARRAVEALGQALKGSGGFTVAGVDGTVILKSGEQCGSVDAESIADRHTLRTQIAAPRSYRAVLEMQARPGESFTPRDVKLFDAAAASFASWLPSVIRRLSATERRVAARSFDQIVDRYAREAHAAHDDASLILISAGAEALSTDTTHAWIRRVRPQLRPTDLAGRLTSGELGILLLQTPQAGAQVVARRLSRVLTAGPLAANGPAMHIGVASQAGELVSAEALIARARRQPFDQPVPIS